MPTEWFSELTEMVRGAPPEVKAAWGAVTLLIAVRSSKLSGLGIGLLFAVSFLTLPFAGLLGLLIPNNSPHSPYSGLPWLIWGWLDFIALNGVFAVTDLARQRVSAAKKEHRFGAVAHALAGLGGVIYLTMVVVHLKSG